MRQGPQSASMNNLLCDYKIGFSANANKMDVRQTKLNIINNISSSKAIEREGGSAKLSFYRDLSRKGEKFMNPERPQSQHPSEAKHRPMTAITRTTEARPFSTSEMTNWKTMSPRNIDLTEQPKPKNPNLPGHYQRTMTANSSQKKRTTSAFAIKNTRPLLSAGQVRPQTGVHVNYPVREISVEEEESSKVAIYKPEIPALTNKNRDTKINRQKSMHENETRGSNSPILSPNSRTSPSKKKGNFKKFSKVQEKDESSVDSYTRRMEAERPINYDETRLLLKRIEQDLGELVEQQSHVKKELLKEQREEFTRNMQGEPAALEPMMPWERVSIYMPDDPDFNSPLFKGEFVRPPILEIKPKDELEVQQLMDEVHERYNYFVKSCEVKHDTEYKFLKTSPDRLTVVELEKIQAQYDAKAAGQPFDVNLVESIVTPLPFFMKFDSGVRHKLLYKAQMATYQNGHVLFRQGDFGDKMYVILSGSANVVIHYNDPVSGKPTDRIVAWMKDGSSFGEYSMLGTKSRGGKDSVFVNISRLTNDLTNRLVYLKRAIIGQQEIDLKANNPVEDWKKMKEEQKELALGLNNPKPKPVEEPQTYVERTKRAADIIATEELTVLELSRDYFKEVILLTIKDEYERKIKLLSELPLFKAHEFMSLMPIVNFLQRKEYKLGQTVLKQGDPLNGFFMIYEGRCKIVYICSHKRKKEVSMHVKGLKSKLPKFCFGNEPRIIRPKTSNPENQLGPEQYFKSQIRLLPEEKAKFKRQFTFSEDPEMDKLDPDHIHYEGHIESGYLERGEPFGFRSAMMFTMENKAHMEVTEAIVEPAKISIIVETSKVVLYYFPMKSFKYLPEDIKKTIIAEAKSTPDYDAKDVEKLKKEGERWDAFKEQIYLQTVQQQYYRRRTSIYKDY